MDATLFGIKGYKIKNWLIHEYWTEEKSIGDIAREYAETYQKEVWQLEGLVQYWMIKHGIKRRTRSEATSLTHRKAGLKSKETRKRERIYAKLIKISQQLFDLAEEIK